MRKATLPLVALLALLALSASWAQAQTFTILYSVPNGFSPLAAPSSLLRDKAGNFYVVGDHGNGSVAKLDTSGNVTVLHIFTDVPDGAGPLDPLVRDKEGNLYGATRVGGASAFGGGGTVFKLDTAGNETVLHSFTGPPDGVFPQAGLVRDKAGNLYGTTLYGGVSASLSGFGTVFKLDTAGNETVLHSFTQTDGANPVGGLVMDKAGNLYGTTNSGGPTGNGTVFKLDTSGNETVLHSFTYFNGSSPTAGLIRDKEGNLYGTTDGGGANGLGTVFKLDTVGHLTVLHSFTNAPDGAFPYAGLVMDKAGNLYGTTPFGGSSPDFSGYGIVFKVDTSGSETVLHTFTGADGASPSGGLIMDKRGNLYGSAEKGGASWGVIFELVP